jgi:signal transduction histidine kinase
MFLLVWLPLVAVLGIASYMYWQMIENAEIQLLQSAISPEYYSTEFIDAKVFSNPNQYSIASNTIVGPLGSYEFESTRVFAVIQTERNGTLQTVQKFGSDTKLSYVEYRSILSYIELAGSRGMGGEQHIVSQNGRKWLLVNTGSFDLYQSYVDASSVIESGNQDGLYPASSLLYQTQQELVATRSVYMLLDVSEMESLKLKYIIFFQGITLLLTPLVLSRSLSFANRSIQPVLESWDKQKDFIANASHEIKTPLSIIYTNYEALLANSDETIASQSHWLDSIGIGIERLVKLNDYLLSSARLDNVDDSYTSEPVDLSELLEMMLMSYQATSLSKDLELTVHIEPQVVVSSNTDILEKAIHPLLENAFEYVESNGKVMVSLAKRARQIIIEISNSGPGIPKEALSKVFDPFYRVDDAHNGNGRNYGLGLNIAKQAVQTLGGNISLESIPGVITVSTLSIDAPSVANPKTFIRP